MNVELVYCAEEQNHVYLNVADDCTVEQAIRLSGFLERYPAWQITTLKIGIFSQLTTLDAQLNAGDRIEIYRPLQIDPKQARILRAKKSKS